MISLKKLAVQQTSTVLLVNVLIGALVTWLSLPKDGFIPLLGGPESAGFGLFPASILFPFLATLLMTMGIKKQLAAGDLVVDSRAVSSPMPKNTVVLAVLLTVLCTAVAAPLTLLLAKIVLGTELAFAQALVLNLVYLMMITVIVIPNVVYCAVRAD